LMHGELIIAGKAHSEILSMKNKPRFRWYMTILPEEKEKAIEMMEDVRRTKISENNAMKNPKVSAKISEIKTEYWRNPENRAKMIGRNNPFFGKTHSKETRAKLRAIAIGRIMTEETRIKISQTLKGSFTSEETRDRNKGKNNPMYGRTGETHPNWQGGISFEPYCSKFNNQLKESIRNHDNRTCVLCGTGEIQNGQRLSVHHIDGDKMQGCSGKSWYLCALCRSCNSRPDTVEKEFLIVSNSKPRRQTAYEQAF